MCDARFVEIIGGFVEKKNVGFLDECGGKEETRLLTAGEGLYDAVVRSMKIYDIENFVDERIDVIYLFFETRFEKRSDGEMHLGAGNHLACGGDGKSVRDVDTARFRMKHSRNELENGAFSCAVLTHEGDFPSVPQRKIRLTQNGNMVTVFERHGIKPQYNFIA